MDDRELVSADVANLQDANELVLTTVRSLATDDRSLEDINEPRASDDGWQYICYLPNGTGPLRCMLDRKQEPTTPPLYFVGFFGTKRNPSQGTGSVLATSVWSADRKLRERMRSHPSVVYYMTVQKEKDGNWCNLILSTSPTFLSEWASEKDHGAMVQ